ncbi:hypothetical protein BGX21_007384, partial [Mortierella sp. AD011]
MRNHSTRSSSAQPSASRAKSLRQVRIGQKDVRTNVLKRPNTARSSKPPAAPTPKEPFVAMLPSITTIETSQDEDMQDVESEVTGTPPPQPTDLTTESISDDHVESALVLEEPEVTWTPVERRSHHRGYEFRIPLDKVKGDSDHTKLKKLRTGLT